MSTHEKGPDTIYSFNERVDVANLRPNTFNLPCSFVEGTVALLWPYSSSHGILSLLVVEKDVRHRRAKGQVKVSFHGHCAREVARTRIGIGDDVKLSLDNASWVHTGEEIATPGKKVAYDLEYRIALAIEIKHGNGSVSALNVVAQTPSPVSPVLSPGHSESAASTSSRTALTAVYKPINYSTPTRVPSTSFIDATLDPFAEDDGFIVGRGRKRTKFARHSGAWKLLDDDDESNDNGIASGSDHNSMISHSDLHPASVDEQARVPMVTTDSASEKNGIQNMTRATKPSTQYETSSIEHPIPSLAIRQDAVVGDPEILQNDEPLRSLNHRSHSPVPEDLPATASPLDLQPAESPRPARESSPEIHVAAMNESTLGLNVLPSSSEPLTDNQRSPEILLEKSIPDPDLEAQELHAKVDDSGDNQSDYTAGIESRATPFEIISDDEVDNSETDFQLQQPMPEYEDALSPAIVESLVHFENEDVADDMLSGDAPVVPAPEHGQITAEIEMLIPINAGDSMLDEVVDLDALQQQIDDQVEFNPKFVPLDTGIEDDDLYGSPAATRSLPKAVDFDNAGPPGIEEGPGLQSSYTVSNIEAVDEQYKMPQSQQMLNDHVPDEIFPALISQSLPSVEDFGGRLGEANAGVDDDISIARLDQPLMVESYDFTQTVLLPSSDDGFELEQRELVSHVESSTPSSTYDGTQDSGEESVAPDASVAAEREESGSDPNENADEANVVEEQQSSTFSSIVKPANTIPDVGTIAPRPVSFVEEQVTYKHLTPPATQQGYTELPQSIMQEPAYVQTVPLTPELTQKNRSRGILDSAIDQAQVESGIEEEYRLPPMSRRDTQSPPQQPLVRLYSSTTSSDPASNPNLTSRDAIDIERGPPVIPSESLSAEEEASQPLVSSPNATETRENLQDVPLPPVLHGTTTSHSYYPRLGLIDEYFNYLIDIVAVVSSSTPAQKAKSGPRDYFTTLHLVDPSRAPNSTVIAQLFRPRKSALPTANRGDVILFRDLKVQTQDRKPMLLSTESSAWMMFETRSGSASNTSEGPPVEFGHEEEQMCEQLRQWWAGNSINYEPVERAATDRETRSASPMVTRSQRKKSQGATPSTSVDLGSPVDHVHRPTEAIHETPTQNLVASQQPTEIESHVVSHTNRRIRPRPRHRSRRSESTVLGTDDSQMSPSSYREGSLVHELRDGLTYVDE